MGATNLRFSRAIARLNDQRRGIGVATVWNDMGVCRDEVAAGDHKARAAHGELRAVGLLVGADDDDRRLDMLDGVGHLG